MQTETLQVQPAHALNAKEREYIKSLQPNQVLLHQLATKMLGSSYFVGKTHGFRAWEAKQKQPSK